MRYSYKQKCTVCRKNMALVTWKNRNPVCTECTAREIATPIEDEQFRKLFDIDPALYQQSSFLRNIKSNYLRYGSLSERQIEIFKKVADEIKNQRSKPKEMDGEVPQTDRAVEPSVEQVPTDETTSPAKEEVPFAAPKASKRRPSGKSTPSAKKPA